MSNDKPAREWWIELAKNAKDEFDKGGWGWVEKPNFREQNQFVHVIEHSAYAAVCAERDALRVWKASKDIYCTEIEEEMGREIRHLTRERDDLRAEVERLTKLTSGMEDYAVLQRSVQKDHLALLAEAEAALERISSEVSIHPGNANKKMPTLGAGIARETLARLREKKGGEG